MLLVIFWYIMLFGSVGRKNLFGIFFKPVCLELKFLAFSAFLAFIEAI